MSRLALIIVYLANKLRYSVFAYALGVVNLSFFP